MSIDENSVNVMCVELKHVPLAESEPQNTPQNPSFAEPESQNAPVDVSRETCSANREHNSISLSTQECVSPRTHIELLAPAGNMECVRAAVCAGADAVYLGLGEFNARRNADNFTMESLREAAEFAHLRGVSIYITLNIEILPSEIDRAVQFARDAFAAGCDAFIVQDLGLCATLREQLPSAPIHISTQMNIHNKAGVQACARLGATRVTLARELSFAEISELSSEAAQLGMEVETFAHGALCACYSGQCLMSSLIGGRSANRGLCAQACRLPYELTAKEAPASALHTATSEQAAQESQAASTPQELHVTQKSHAVPAPQEPHTAHHSCSAQPTSHTSHTSDAASSAQSAPGDHLLSPRDLCTAEVLPELIATGTSSLKIEGRMKSASYVYTVVLVYRRILDRLYAGDNPRPTPDEQTALSQAFSRGFTTAYLNAQRGNSIMSYGRPNNRGVFIGRTECSFHKQDAGKSSSQQYSARQQRSARQQFTRKQAFEQRKHTQNTALSATTCVYVTSSVQLFVGDVLEIYTNKGNVVYQLLQSDIDAYPHQGFGCSLNHADLPKSATKGNRVFRVRAARNEFVEQPFEPRIPVHLDAVFELGKPAHIAFHISRTWHGYVRMNCADTLSGEAWGEAVAPARTKELTEHDVFAHINRLGQTPFCIVSHSIRLSEGVGGSFSDIHRLRSQALSVLEKEIYTAHQVFSRAQARVHPDDSLSKSADLEQLVHPRSPMQRCTSTAQNPSVVAWATNPRCARAAKRAGASMLYLPIVGYKRDQASLQGVRQVQPEQGGYPKQKIMCLPTINHDPLKGTRESRIPFDVWQYVVPGKRVFCDSFSAAFRALELGADVEIGPHVPITNTASVRLLEDMGVKRVWLSPELTLGQIAFIAERTSISMGLCVSGAQEMMVTEHCLLMSEGACNEQCPQCERRSRAHALHDRKGYNFPVITDMFGRSHLYNGVALDAVPSIPDLLDIGIDAFMVDTTLLSPEESSRAVARVQKAIDCAGSTHISLEKLVGTTTGHLFRGVQ